MKIFNRSKFLELPAGTIYAKGIKWAFERLCIKGDSISSYDGQLIDWAEFDPCGIKWDEYGSFPVEKMEEMLLTGSSCPCDDDGYGRDGCFDDDQIFLVFEKDDLIWFRSMIDAAIEISK
jgi:hypothetical protein